VERDDRERLLWQLAGKDNWDAVNEVNDWMVMFDFLPPRMRITVDLKMQGYTVSEIAQEMGICKSMVYRHLQYAKNRIMQSLL
jgi:DNA-directed RNA polymerase specialized sigma24 family protein